MIRLKSEQICDDFKGDKKLYANRITEQIAKKISNIEDIIKRNGREFLTDPEYWITMWEDLTGEDIPRQYSASVPKEITGRSVSLTKKGKTYYFYRFFPVVDAKGKTINYPADRKVYDHKPVYILQDDVMKELAVVVS